MEAAEYFDRGPGQAFFGDTRYPNFVIGEYFDELGISYRTHESGEHTEYAINCPKCMDRGEKRADVKYRLWLNDKTAYFHCFNCDWGGLLPWMVKHLSNVTYQDAIKILMGKQFDSLDRMNFRLFDEKIEAESDISQLKELKFPYGYNLISGPVPYLEERGVPWEWARDNDWGVGMGGFCDGRLIVPTYMEDRLVFWQGRAMWKDEENPKFKKVLNPSNVSAKPILYNFDKAKGFETVVIAEGFMDAAKIGDDAVATNGKRIHPEQIEYLVGAGVRNVVLMWDWDAWLDSRKHKGEVKPSSVERAVGALKVAFNVKVVKMPDERDPGDYIGFPPTGLRRMIEGAKEFA